MPGPEQSGEKPLSSLSIHLLPRYIFLSRLSESTLLPFRDETHWREPAFQAFVVSGCILRRLFWIVLEKRTSRRNQKLQRRQEHSALKSWIPGPPDAHSILSDQADLAGMDAFFLQVMYKRTLGARTKRSDRNQKGPVDPLRPRLMLREGFSTPREPL